LSDSRTFGLTFKEVLLIDSTTIRLFSNVLKGVGRYPKGDGKKKGGLKVHMLIDAVQSVGRFIKITAAKVHDKNFLKSLELISHNMVVFDKAYNYYHQFALWTHNQVYFVSRLKTNAVYTVIEVTRRHYRKKGEVKVLSDEIVLVSAYCYYLTLANKQFVAFHQGYCYLDDMFLSDHNPCYIYLKVRRTYQPTDYHFYPHV
jgi:hypothetical protein